MTISLEYSQITNLVTSLGETNQRIDAVRSFNQAYNRGRLAHFVANVFHRNNHLRTLTAQPGSSPHPTSRIVTIPIRQIKGSLDRSADFDTEFHPLHERSRSRWVSILTAIRSNVSLPPVELVQVGNEYYVRDGHHRISVARSLDQQAIEARIVN